MKDTIGDYVFQNESMLLEDGSVDTDKLKEFNPDILA